jgi:hypothetical protein
LDQRKKKVIGPVQNVAYQLAGFVAGENLEARQPLNGQIKLGQHLGHAVYAAAGGPKTGMIGWRSPARGNIAWATTVVREIKGLIELPRW